MDPRYKLLTFRNLERKEEWITEAQTSFINVYNTEYAPQQVTLSTTSHTGDTDATSEDPTSGPEDDFM